MCRCFPCGVGVALAILACSTRAPDRVEKPVPDSVFRQKRPPADTARSGAWTLGDPRDTLWLGARPPGQNDTTAVETGDSLPGRYDTADVAGNAPPSRSDTVAVGNPPSPPRARTHARPPEGSPPSHPGARDGPDSSVRAPSDLSSIELGKLRPGEFELAAPKTMVQGTPELVKLRLAKDTVLPPTTASPSRVVRTAPTLVGDSARACLEGGDDFDVQHTPDGGKCHTQLVTHGTDNTWQWRVTPKNYGKRLILVASVEALLAGLPGKTLYRDSVAVVVAVKPCPLTELACLKEWLGTWEGILSTAGSIVALILGWLGWKRKKSRSAGQH